MTEQHAISREETARRRAIVEALQQVVTTQRSAQQSVALLRPLAEHAPNTDGQEAASLHLALEDAEETVRLCQRTRVLIAGTGSIS